MYVHSLGQKILINKKKIKLAKKANKQPFIHSFTIIFSSTIRLNVPKQIKLKRKSNFRQQDMTREDNQKYNIKSNKK